MEIWAFVERARSTLWLLPKRFFPAAPFLVICLKNKQTKHSHSQIKQNKTNKFFLELFFIGPVFALQTSPAWTPRYKEDKNKVRELTILPFLKSFLSWSAFSPDYRDLLFVLHVKPIKEEEQGGVSTPPCPESEVSPPSFYNVATRKYKIVSVTPIIFPVDRATVDLRFLACK